MQTACTTCPPDTYNTDGSRCYECPTGTFADRPGSAACTPCTAPFLRFWNYTVYRNSQQRLRVIPIVCQEDNDFAIESMHQIKGSDLGTATASPETPSVRYDAGHVLGQHSFDVYVTSAHQAPIQKTTVEVTIANRAPVTNDDDLVIQHPLTATTLDFSTFIFNDFDPDKDDIYFATASLVVSYSASNLQISADRKHMSLDLPAGFTGIATLTYTVMDAFRTDVADCLAPTCLLSNAASVTLTSRTAAPVAVDDAYDVLNGEVYSLDVTLNDIDLDNDEITIVDVSTSVFGSAPQIATVCGCSGACAGIAACTCSNDAAKGKCWPSLNRNTVITYTAPGASCGTDAFSYQIQTNDGKSSAVVRTKVRRCYCASHAVGIDLVFLVDGTTSVDEFHWQLSLVEAIQKRTSDASGDFRYGLISAGQDTFHKNATTAGYIVTDTTDAPADGQNFPYELAAPISKINLMLGAPTGRWVVVVVVSAHDVTDEVVSAAGALTTAYTNVRFVTVSVHPDAVPYKHLESLNSRYDATVREFSDLGSSALAQAAMDEICSL